MPNIFYGACCGPVNRYELPVPAATLLVKVLQIRQPNHRHGLLSLRLLIALLRNSLGLVLWLEGLLGWFDTLVLHLYRRVVIFFFSILISNFSIQ